MIKKINTANKHRLFCIQFIFTIDFYKYLSIHESKIFSSASCPSPTASPKGLLKDDISHNPS